MLRNTSAPRVLFVALLALLVFTSTGCSVLGIATKGDLENQQQRWDAREVALTAQAVALEAELESIASGLAGFQGELGIRLAGIESDLDHMDTLRARLAKLDERLTAARQELTIVSAKIIHDMSAIRDDVAETHAVADRADEQGRQVMHAQLADLRAERRFLREQLEEVESRVREWSEMSGEGSLEPASVRRLQ